ncbi:MAG TPA: hypothetical protein V6C97_02230 [Oculatellaceae cyanobacterium]
MFTSPEFHPRGQDGNLNHFPIESMTSRAASCPAPGVGTTDTSKLIMERPESSTVEKNILNRAYTTASHKRLAIAESYIHHWLNQFSDADSDLAVYSDTPRPSGFEHNISGLTEAYLMRVEAQWKSGASAPPYPFGPGKVLH